MLQVINVYYQVWYINAQKFYLNNHRGERVPSKCITQKEPRVTKLQSCGSTGGDLACCLFINYLPRQNTPEERRKTIKRKNIFSWQVCYLFICKYFTYLQYQINNMIYFRIGLLTMICCGIC